MAWQREDDGSQVYESDSLWRAVVYNAAGVYGAYVECPSERPISSPDSFTNMAEARAWCLEKLAELDPPVATRPGPATHTLSPSRCPLCYEAVTPDQLQQHLRTFHRKPVERYRSPRPMRPITPERAKRSSPPPMTQSTVPSPPRSTVPTACPICHKVLKTLEGVKSHLQAKHGDAFGDAASQLNPVPQPNIKRTIPAKPTHKAPAPDTAKQLEFQCPLCFFVSRDSFQQSEHVRVMHRAELDRAIANHKSPPRKQDTAAPAAVSPSASTRRSEPRSLEPEVGKPQRPCPLCQKLIHPDELAHHMRMQHGKRLTKAERLARNEASQSGGRSRDDISLEALEQSFQDKRDASRGWGHHRRDYDGTWGSMPVHDDYSDESSAY